MGAESEWRKWHGKGCAYWRPIHIWVRSCRHNMCVCHMCSGPSSIYSPAIGQMHTLPSLTPPHPSALGAGKTVICLDAVIPLFQITWPPPFCNMLFFRQFTVKLIRLQLSSSTFQSCRYALVTLITLGCVPSLHQQRTYNHGFALSHSQNYTMSISKFPGCPAAA